MSKELRTILWCDGKHKTPTEAETTHVVGIDRTGMRELDLCAACVKTLLAPLLAVLEEHGQPISKSGKTIGGLTCPECGKVCKNAPGLGSHRSRTHGVTSKTRREAEAAAADR